MRNNLAREPQNEENIQSYIDFADIMHQIRPEVLPAFCFGWFTIITHKNFLPIMLEYEPVKNNRRYENYKILVVDMLVFLKQNIFPNQPLNEDLQILVDGVTKFFYCIAKDYMNFISVYYFEFINAIPDKLKQIRNLILSAFPMKNEIPQSPFDDEV